MFYSPSAKGFYSEEIHGENIPGDSVEISTERHQELLQGQSQGKIIVTGLGGFPELQDPVGPTLDQIKQGFIDKMQDHLDDFAKTRNYGGILSATTYATSSVPKFQSEGQYAVLARDMTWSAGYTILAEVESGLRPLPTWEELLADLPVLEWPVL